LGLDDRRPRRHARSARLGHFRRPGILSPDPLLVVGMAGQRGFSSTVSSSIS
jgi:hypothetical protein